MAPETTGRQLRATRKKARLSAQSVAVEMGVRHQRIFALEAARVVTPTAALRFLLAVEAATVARDSQAAPIADAIAALSGTHG